MIAAWHGHIPAGTRTSQPVIIEDVFPTLLSVAQLKHYRYQVPQVVDGYGYGASSAIRLGDWKLVYMYKTGQKELFNLEDDIGEQYNLDTEYPRKTQELTKKLRHYLKRVKAQLPINKKTGKPIELN